MVCFWYLNKTHKTLYSKFVSWLVTMFLQTIDTKCDIVLLAWLVWPKLVTSQIHLFYCTVPVNKSNKTLLTIDGDRYSVLFIDV